jgi:transglutaminase-like putative cysteine protease
MTPRMALAASERSSALLSILGRRATFPARQGTGYLGNIGVPRESHPMDFNAWFKAYVVHRWSTFDARHNVPRIGRIVMAYGR